MSAIYKKMSEVMKDIGSVSKDQKNLAQGFKFRGIDQFVNALYPALTKHGVFMTPRATRFETEVKDVTRANGKAGVDKHVSILMEYDFFAEDGSKVTVGPIPAEGLDSGDKATNKALSAALKYALIQTFSIPTEDMAEADLDSPELAREAPKRAPSVSVPLVATTGSGTLPTAVTSTVVTNTVVAAPSTDAPVATEKKGNGSFRKPPKTTPAKTTPVVETTPDSDWS